MPKSNIQLLLTFFGENESISVIRLFENIEKVDGTLVYEGRSYSSVERAINEAALRSQGREKEINNG